MKAKEHWIEETLGSLDGIRGAKASSALVSKLESMADMPGFGSRILRPALYWPAAAALALLLAMNILVFTNYHRSSAQSKGPTEILADDYLSYLGPIKL